MVRGECVWDVCVYVSCTVDEGQLGSIPTTISLFLPKYLLHGAESFLRILPVLS
jgi:hypothetical protein